MNPRLSPIETLKAAFNDALDTASMTTDELLVNARAALNWADNVKEDHDGTGQVFAAEALALRYWETLDKRLAAGESIPVAWLGWRIPETRPWVPL